MRPEDDFCRGWDAVSGVSVCLERLLMGGSKAALCCFLGTWIPYFVDGSRWQETLLKSLPIVDPVFEFVTFEIHYIIS